MVKTYKSITKMKGSKEMFLEIQQQAAQIVDDAEIGEILPIDALVELHQMKRESEQIVNLCKSYIDSNIMQLSADVEEYKEGYRGFIFEYRKGGVSYDYSNIPEISEAESSLKTTKEKYKQMFISKQKGLPFANVDEDGEELPLPEVKYRKSSLIVKPKPLKKK